MPSLWSTPLIIFQLLSYALILLDIANHSDIVSRKKITKIRIEWSKIPTHAFIEHNAIHTERCRFYLASGLHNQ